MLLAQPAKQEEHFLVPNQCLGEHGIADINTLILQVPVDKEETDILSLIMFTLVPSKYNAEL